MVATRRTSQRLTKKAKLEEPTEVQIVVEKSTLKEESETVNDFQDPVIVPTRFMRTRRTDRKRKAVIDDSESISSFLSEDKGGWSYAATPESSNSSISIDIEDKKGKGKEVVKNEVVSKQVVIDNEEEEVDELVASEDELDFSAVASSPSQATEPEFINDAVDQQEDQESVGSSNHGSDGSSSEEEAPAPPRTANARRRREVAPRGAARRLQYVSYIYASYFIYLY